MNKVIIYLCLFAFIYSIDMDAAVRHLVSNAHQKSQGRCAAYVYHALEAGGFRFTSQASAYMYRNNGVLKSIGYNEISKPSSFKKGDITVTDRNNDHPHGHIAMWSGSQWISDFFQKSEYVYSYNQPKVYYFRYGGSSTPSTPSTPSGKGCNGKSITEIAREVLSGKWGNGDERKRRLAEAGCDYSAVQKEVNRLAGY